MKALKFIGAIIYSIVINFAFQKFFIWLTPIVMTLNWWWFLLLLIIIVVYVKIVIYILYAILMFPLIYLVKDNKHAKMIPTMFGIVNCLFTVVLPWRLNIEYGLLQWLIALSWTYTK